MSTDTYSETQHEPPFDWREFLLRDLHTLSELSNAQRLANCWVTCACGNLCSVIPRDDEGEPHDTRLSLLGNDFANAIRLIPAGPRRALGQQACADAIAILDAIEQRSLILIAEATEPVPTSYES